jgi:hypothetical protein
MNKVKFIWGNITHKKHTFCYNAIYAMVAVVDTIPWMGREAHK